jgi:hypothetical protein
MTIGMCLDFVDEYVDMKNPPEETVVEAQQGHFDAF